MRSPAEIGDRARQRLLTWLELIGDESRGQEPSDAVLERALRPGRRTLDSSDGRDGDQRRAGEFPFFRDGARVGALVRTQFPNATTAIIARADRAVTDRFDIFGREGLSYGNPIDWHLDPLRGKRAPLVHWSRIPYLDVEQVGDHKVIWELNRHQHLVTLGQAYCLTGERRYADTIVRHLDEWMDANPPKLGINWASSLELSFRAIAWTWALHLVRDSDAMSPRFVNRIMKFLHLHARHISAHLSRYFSPNTHLTGEALGLLYVGTCFDEFHDSARWRELGWSILERELSRQVRPDGIYFEQTTWYQRYTADFYLHALQLRERSGYRVAENVRRRIGEIVDPLVQLTDPAGLTPLIGDDDGGQLLPLSSGQPSDFRATLAHAAVLFQRADCAALGSEAASCLPWLVGESGTASFNAIEQRLPSATAELFRDGGYVVARDRWAPDADFLVVDCGPHGSLSCGHAHADALSFALTLGGVPVVVDPGTYSYVEPGREEFRGTAAHNTVCIDDLSSSEPDRPFRWKSAAACTVSRTIFEQGQFAFFEGEHDGYMRLPDPARHRRTIFARYGEFVAILDVVEATGVHTITGRFHFSPTLAVVASDDGTKLVASTRAPSAAPVLDALVVGQDVALSVEMGRVAPTYGLAIDAPVGTYRSNGAGIRHFWTLLVPRRRERGEPTAVSMRSQSGRAVAFRSAEVEDLIIAGSDGPQRHDLSTDADWVWIRRTVPRAQATEFIALNASRLELDGTSVVSLPDRRQHVRGRWLETGWELHVSPT
jgi:hypothetical protein